MGNSADAGLSVADRREDRGAGLTYNAATTTSPWPDGDTVASHRGALTHTALMKTTRHRRLACSPDADAGSSP